MAIRRSIPLSLALLSLALLVGACTPWTVVQRSGPPSKLVGSKTITVAHDLSEMTVQGIFGWSKIDKYREKLKAKEKAAKNFEEVLVNLKKSLNDGFKGSVRGVTVKEAAGKPAPNEVRVTFKTTRLRQGKYAVVMAVPTELTLQAIWSIGDKVVDIIEMNTQVNATIMTPSIHQRVKKAGRTVGSWTGDFFNKAQKGK